MTRNTNTDYLAAYIEQQVQSAADSKIRPLQNAILSEVEAQRNSAAILKAAQEKCEKDVKASEERVAALQKSLAEAKADVYDLQRRLTEAGNSASE